MRLETTQDKKLNCMGLQVSLLLRLGETAETASLSLTPSLIVRETGNRLAFPLH